MTVQLRNSDPAPSAIDPHSAQADAMLTDILMTPRVVPNHQRRRVIGLGLATAAAAAVVAVPAFWPGDSAPSSARAFTVTEHSDGSIGIAIEEDDFKDGAALEQALADKGIQAHVRVHQYPAGYKGRIMTDIQPTAGCHEAPTLPRLHSADYPVEVGPIEPDIVTLHPDRLPTDGAFLLDAYRVGDKVSGFGPNYEICPD